jgi:hypothetical protein
MENISNHHAELSDSQLVSEAKRLAVDEREATVRLVGLLAVLDERRCYLAEGYGSTFSFCVRALGLSEYAAFHRIKAARTVQRFPVVLERLSSGALTLEAVRLLAPHLTVENHVRLLDAAAGKSKRGIDKMLAVLFPRPDVPARVRKLPVPRVDAVPSSDEAGTGALSPAASSNVFSIGVLAAADESRAERREGAVVPAVTHLRCSSINLPWHLRLPPQAPAVQCARHRAVVEPLAAERYRVQLTISGETHEKLRRAQDLLRHQIPDGDLATVFDRAITLLVSDLERKKCALVSRPREEAKSSRPACVTFCGGGTRSRRTGPGSESRIRESPRPVR